MVCRTISNKILLWKKRANTEFFVFQEIGKSLERDLIFNLGEYDDDVDDDHEYIDDKDDYHDYNGDDDDAGAKTRYDICGIPPALISPQFG